MRKTLGILIAISCISNYCLAQSYKIGIRGGTFSPYSLENALAKKNPNPGFNRYTTSNPFCLSIGIQKEEGNNFVFGLNASYRKIDIQQTFRSNYEVGYAFWENYDFDFNFGYKMIKTPRSSLKSLIGLGIQKRFEYIFDGFIPYVSVLPDSSVVITRTRNEIKAANNLPVFMVAKIEADFALSNR